MINKIRELFIIREDKVELSNNYIFGEADITLSEFVELFKDKTMHFILRQR